MSKEKGECYGYDEFGQDLSLRESSYFKGSFAVPYTKQGEGQPFGYTGYRYDDVSGSYFAQAREYQPGIGRFMAEDVIRGRMEIPKTLNRYGYCWGNPMIYVDLNGAWPEWVENAADIVGNWVGEAVQEIKSTAADYLIKGVEWIEEQVSDLQGTVSLKVTANGNAFMGIAGDIGVSLDFQGNLSVQVSYAVPSIDDTVSIGLLDVGLGIALALTDAQTVDGLLGPSSSIGLSGGVGWSIGGDLISFEDMSDMSGDIDGFQITSGIGLGADIHMIEPYTHELVRWNIYDVIKEKLREFGGKECE